MNAPKTTDDINDLLLNQIEESQHLEYKSADALNNTDSNKKEISKDISAMANADGGVIIYGIKEYDAKEKRHLPEEVTPIDRIKYTKEWLENVIQSNIRPRIEGLIIHPIQLPKNNEVVYAVEIPQSTTAHQAADFRYYRRYNFQNQPMYDYEIRDVMNRSKHPQIEIEFYIQKYKKLGELSYSLPPTSIFEDYKVKRKIKIEHYLKFDLINNGMILANYITVEIELPKNILYDPRKNIYNDNEYIKEVHDNTTKDIVEDSDGLPRIGPARYTPLLPKLKNSDHSIKLCDSPKLDKRMINWTIYADNAHPRSGSIQLDQIRFEEIDETSNE